MKLLRNAMRYIATGMILLAVAVVTLWAAFAVGVSLLFKEYLWTAGAASLAVAVSAVGFWIIMKLEPEE